MGLSPGDFHSNRIVPRAGVHHLPTGYRRPWAIAREAANKIAADMKNLHFGKDGFQACVDVHHFKPSEITVKAVGHVIVIEGNHEEREDGHGSVQRHFIRKYDLPEDYDMNTVHSSLSSDGVITVTAQPRTAIKGGERMIPITHTHIPAHLSVKDKKTDNGETLKP